MVSRPLSKRKKVNRRKEGGWEGGGAASFVPRPSHCPVLSIAVCPFYHMNDISVYLGRQRGRVL